MKTTPAIIFFFACTTAITQAQDWSFFGHAAVETGLHHATDPAADPAAPWNGLTDWLTARLSAELDSRLVLDPVSLRVHQGLSFDQEHSFDYRLYEAYITLLAAPWVSFDIGKKYSDRGTSLFFMPADRLNPRNTETTSLRRDYGFSGITMTLTPNADFSVAASVSLDEALKHLDSSYWEDFRYALLVSMVLAGLELKTGLTWQIDRVFRPSLALSWDLAGFILNAEYALELNNRTFYPSSPLVWGQPELWKPYSFISAGILKVFSTDDWSLQVSAEYLYTDTGFTPQEESDFFNAIPLATAVLPEYLGRHYLFASIGFELTKAFSLENSLFWNIQDQSLLAWHRLTLLSIANLDLYAQALWSLGSSTTEFGSAPEQLVVSAGALFHF